ncbi:carboxymuconolactone decarboxylase family protein [Saccharothrix obliqua]|uniref:carboxymuconolactone decarboxylase family protein n=1 Tax=Saccharothrix obliqua TaxID=2861747 RepID=UPI001C5F1309|nr:carboxymuconolactone decarboxylase family protein [Saccharothrix obliqua]MBW4718229.1 carboxymuconolactone decarboxylase family protein [Saccharothrix obliqua]
MTIRLPVSDLTPATLAAMSGLSTASKQNSLDPLLRELVQIRASQINGCAYCTDLHTRAARAAGERQQRLDLLPVWREAPGFDDRERAALALAEAVTVLSSGVPEDVRAEAAEQFDERELTELLWVIAVINTWNRMVATTGAWEVSR